MFVGTKCNPTLQFDILQIFFIASFVVFVAVRIIVFILTFLINCRDSKKFEKNISFATALKKLDFFRLHFSHPQSQYLQSQYVFLACSLIWEKKAVNDRPSRWVLPTPIAIAIFPLVFAIFLLVFQLVLQVVFQHIRRIQNDVMRVSVTLIEKILIEGIIDTDEKF